MPRIARVVVPDYPHHITQRGTNKMDIFLDNEDRTYFIQCVKDYLSKTQTRLWAFCLMSNHFHLLLVPEEEESLKKCLHGITFRYAQYFNLKYKRSGRLWQNRYFSCIVDKNSYLWAVARYIERNPVRAGIVAKLEDWRWSSAQAHIQSKRADFPSLTEWLEESELESYKKFVSVNGNEEEIRKSTSTGRPLGDLDFLCRMEEITGRLLRPKKAGRPRKRS
jgi:putative transposase